MDIPYHDLSGAGAPTWRLHSLGACWLAWGLSCQYIASGRHVRLCYRLSTRGQGEDIRTIIQILSVATLKSWNSSQLPTFPAPPVLVSKPFPRLPNPMPHVHSRSPHPILPRHPKVKQSIRREQRQPNRERLPRLHRARNARAGQHKRRQQGQLNAVRGAVAEAEPAEGVLLQCLSDHLFLRVTE